MADKENNTPEKTHIWTDEEIRSLIEWRIKNENFFTGKRYSSKTGWLKFVNTSGLQKISAKQAGKKWNNMKDKYKELKDPPTGKGVEAGSVTAATWKWYSEMDAALGGQHSVNAPLVVASSLTANSGGVVRLDPASTPSTSEAEDEGRGRPKRKKEEVLDFLREQAEREEERHREDIKREEEREKAAAQRAERYLSLFEKLVDKM